MPRVEVVRVQRKSVGTHDVLYVAVPKRLARELDIEGGELLKVYVRELEGRKVLVYERVE